MFNFSTPKEAVGLDIGSYSIKAIELKSKRKGGEVIFEVKKIGYEQLPKDSIVEGTIIDATAVAEAIKILFEEHKISNKNVVISISGNSVIIKKIVLPKMDDEELSETIIWEAKHNIPYPYEETSIDYCILKPGRRLEDTSVEVLLVAAKKDKISNYMGVVDQSSKKSRAIEVDVFALANIAELNYPEIFSTKNIAIINMGANSINLVVLEKGIPQLFRDLSLGGCQITENLSKTLNVGFDDAEKILKGLPIEAKRPEEYQPILDISIQNMLEEIRKTLTFFTPSGTSTSDIDLILISGGLSRFKQLDVKFEEQFEIQTEYLNPFKRIHLETKKFTEFYPDEMGPSFCIAAGLASRQDV